MVDTEPIVLPISSALLTLGQIALGLNAIAIALVLATVPNGSARIAGAVAAIAVVAIAAWLIRSLRRQAIIVTGQRLGYRRGPSGKVTGWTDLADVEVVTSAKLSTSARRGHRDVILWTRIGGLDGLGAALLRAQSGPVRARDGVDDAELRPFLLPMSAVGEFGRDTLVAMLEQHRLVPG